jgi:P-type Mg2+ transporter
VRDGVEGTVHADALVPGDVLVLSAGNLIPADGRILEASDFLVSEASMTGESFPVEKQPGVVPADAPLARRTNVVFLGASVRSGTARVVIVETGRRTVFGAIAARLRAREPETNFAHGLRHFGYLLIRAMVVIVLFVLTVNLLLHRPLIESLFFSVALAVGLSPELLARDRERHTLGGRASHEQGGRHRPPPGRDRKPRKHDRPVHRQDRHADRRDDPSRRRHGSERAHVGRRPATRVPQRGLRDPHRQPDRRGDRHGGGIRGLSTTVHAKIDEIPYDFLRKRLTIVMTEGGDAERHLVVTKGAFLNVLSICPQVERDGAVCVLTDAVTSELSRAPRRKAPCPPLPAGPCVTDDSGQFSRLAPDGSINLEHK